MNRWDIFSIVPIRESGQVQPWDPEAGTHSGWIQLPGSVPDAHQPDRWVLDDHGVNSVNVSGVTRVNNIDI